MFNNIIVHKQVSIFNESLMNIFSNFTPKELVTFDDRDPLGWTILQKVKLNGNINSIRYIAKMVINVLITYDFKRQQFKCLS